MANPTFSFALKPLEAIAYLKQKGFKQSFRYDEIMHEAHHRSFTVAGMMRDDLLADVHASLIDAQTKGIGFKEWQKNITPTLKEKGWYGETDVINPKTGEVRTINVGSNRLRTIYRVNMRVSHSVSRYNKMRALPFSTYWMYVSMRLASSRDTHKAKHGIVLHRDDAWWSTNYPPNAYICYCTVRAYSKKELEKRNIEISQNAPENIADKDWAYNVGEAGRGNLDKVHKDKIAAMPPLIGTIAKNQKKIEEVFKKAIATENLPLATYLLVNKPIIIQKKATADELPPDAQYNPNTKEIYLWTKKPKEWMLRHELSHHIDKINDYISLKELKQYLLLERIALSRVDTDELRKFLANIDDLPINDLFNINHPQIVTKIVTREGVLPEDTAIKETFANILEIIISADYRVAIIEKYFPISTDRVRKIINKVIKK